MALSMHMKATAKAVRQELGKFGQLGIPDGMSISVRCAEIKGEMEVIRVKICCHHDADRESPRPTCQR